MFLALIDILVIMSLIPVYEIIIRVMTQTMFQVTQLIIITNKQLMERLQLVVMAQSRCQIPKHSGLHHPHQLH